VRNLRPRRTLIPRWDMPSDPVKAVFWFLHWSLRLLVRFFYILIIGAVVYESIVNGLVGFAGTLLVGLGAWLGLAVLLFFVNVTTGVSRVFSEVNRLQRNYPPRTQSPPFNFTEPGENRVVEGTITDLEEERRKRRGEMG
jgi:energy-coupling factor transporter transmembrane protein EcfT